MGGRWDARRRKREVRKWIAKLQDKQSRKKAAEKLGVLGDREAIKSLLNAEVGSNQEVCQALYAALENIEEREEAKLRREEARKWVAKLIDKQSRKKVAEKLGELGDRQAFVPLINAHKTENDQGIRAVIADALIKIIKRENAVAARPLAGMDLSGIPWTLLEVLVTGLNDRPKHPGLYAVWRIVRRRIEDEVKPDTAAVNLLLALLKDRDFRWVHTGCHEVISVLGTIQNPHAIKRLVAALNDSDRDVQQTANDALVRIGRHAVTPLIAEINRHNINACETVLEVLRNTPDRRAVKPLITILTHGVRKIVFRRVAVKALCQIADRREVDVLIQVLQSDHDSEVIATVAQRLGEIKVPRAVNPLVSALKHGHNSWVHFAVACALAKFMDIRAIPTLMTTLKSGVSWDREAAARVLVSVGSPAVKPLIGVLTNHKNNAEVRQTAAVTLGEIGDPQAVEPLVMQLGDCDLRVHEAVIEALKKLKYDPSPLGSLATWLIALADWAGVKKLGEAAVHALVTVLRDTIATVEARRAAVQTLGEIGGLQAIEPLIEALKDNDNGVCEAALQALVSIGKPAVKPLIKALTDDDPRVRQMTVVALGKIKDEDKEAVEQLIVTLKNEPMAKVRKDVASTLGKLADYRAVVPLIEKLKGEGEAEVRLAVVKALGRLRDRRAVDQLRITAQTDPVDKVRRAATKALGRMAAGPATDARGA